MSCFVKQIRTECYKGIFLSFWGKKLLHKKGAHQRKTLRHAPGTLMLNPKTSHNFLYLTGQAAAFTASWILSNILALLTVALARLKMVILGKLPLVSHAIGTQPLLITASVMEVLSFTTMV